MVRRFGPGVPPLSSVRPADVVVVILLLSLLAGATQLAVTSPQVMAGPEIRLARSTLPYYAALSFLRMLAAYVLALVFSLGYGYAAAHSTTAERLLMPLLDILQSVPILSYLPIVLLSLSVLLPQRLAVEIAAVALIFTSQAWNLTFSFYQSLQTVPHELREVSRIFRFGSWLRFSQVDLPFAVGGLVWNSMMSWAGGWFFLMAAETFRVGSRDFRLAGLGSYLQAAADRGDMPALWMGLATLAGLIILLDQLVWRPALVWADRFKIESVQAEDPPHSWFYDLLSRSRLVEWAHRNVGERLVETAMAKLIRLTPFQMRERTKSRRPWAFLVLGAAALLLLLIGGARAIGWLAMLPGATWWLLARAGLATLARVALALLLALAWTVPLGVLIGTNSRAATVLGPIVQVVASMPATALFPALLIVFLRLPGGLNLAAVVLMLLGTQWYLLFNVIAGARAIPQDLRDMTRLLGLRGWQRWGTLVVPALLPYLITGLVTASGGAWNASIVAEYAEFAGTRHAVLGLGAVIAQATGVGDYPQLLAATLIMVLLVLLVNRFAWRRLYRLAADRFRLE